MFYKMIENKCTQWYESERCTVKNLIEYIEKTGQMRDAQIEAIKVYLFLKIACECKPLTQLFRQGFFNSIDLNEIELSKSTREYLFQNPAAATLFEYACLTNDKGEQVSEKLEKQIKKDPTGIDYNEFFRNAFYGVSYTDYLFSLPMGAGKTYLMAAFIYLDLYFAYNEPTNPSFAHNFIIFAPSGFNELYAETLGITIKTRHWSKSSYAQSGGKPQALLNEQFVNKCDAAVAIFWTRFGSPTDEYGSGTEEEIEIMLQSGKQVFMYFSDKPIPPSKINGDGYEKIQAFRDKYKDKGIYFTYSSDEEFKKMFFAHLSMHFLTEKRVSETANEYRSELKLLGIDETGRLTEEELELLLITTAEYYDSAFKSKDRPEYDWDFLLSGASAYFLRKDFGSAKVLAARVVDLIDEERSPQKLLTNIYNYLLGGVYLPYLRVIDTYERINNFFLDYFGKGKSLEALKSNLWVYRNEIYENGDPDSIFYVDILVAVIIVACENSSWSLLPSSSGILDEEWESYLQSKMSIKMLWPAQRLIAESQKNTKSDCAGNIIASGYYIKYRKLFVFSTFRRNIGQ